MTNIIKPALTPEQEAARQHWKYRAIEHTRGNQTKLGCILIRICDKMSTNAPRFELKTSAVVGVGGWLCARFQQDNARPFVWAIIEQNVQDYTDALRRLADDLHFNADEREELFTLARQWIGRDYRSTSDPQVAEDRAKAAKKAARRRMH